MLGICCGLQLGTWLLASKRGSLLWAKHDQCWIKLSIEQQNHQQLLLGQLLISLLLGKIISQNLGQPQRPSWSFLCWLPG